MNVERPTSNVQPPTAGDAIPALRRSMLRVRRSTFSRLLTHAALILICGVFLLPLAWMISTSLKPLEDTVEYPPRFIPREVQWTNYRDVFSRDNANFALYARNTLIVAALCVAGTL